jgi:acetate kinase
MRTTDQGFSPWGGTSDVRELELMAASGDPAARLALAMFGRRAAAAIAAAATALPALDGLVFTGGIGEHAASVRADIVRRLALLGVPTMLREVPADAVVAEGPPAVVVVTAREDRMIADEAAALLGDQPPPAG